MSTGKAATGKEWWMKAPAAVWGALASAYSPAVEVRIWIAAPRLGTVDLLREVLLAELFSCLASSILSSCGRSQRAVPECPLTGRSQINARIEENTAIAINSSHATEDGRCLDSAQAPVHGAESHGEKRIVTQHDPVAAPEVR